MRYLALVFSLVILAACGSDSPTVPPAPTTGPVYFRVDGVSCTGGGPITFYIDGAPVGTESLAAGGSSSGPYMTTIGSHAVGAKEVNSPFYVWQSLTGYVTASGFTMLLKCS